MPLLFSKGDKKEKPPARDPSLEALQAMPIPDPTGLSRADPTHWNQLWNSFDRYYKENEKEILEAAKLDVYEISSPKRSMQKDAIVTSFLEHSKTILNGLQFLSELHPGISVVVGAFGALIKIELIRRDNSMKAMSVKIQMQNLMCALFQLRTLRTEEHDYMISQRVAHMMSIVAEEIKACGSDLSYYQDKKLISRLLHAQFFEERLAYHIATFAERRSELNLLFTAYTAGRVHDTMEIASRIECKVENLVNILRRFDSPREKEATKFIEHNGGIEHCISDKTLFIELMGKTGDIIGEGGDAGQSQKADESTTNLMKQLQRELKEDIEAALTKNMANFEAMLRIQNNNLQHMSHLMENQTSEIMKISNEIAMIFPGMRKHVLLTDATLQKIWMEMGLRQSVKAKKFVLTFKDYHTRMTVKTPMIVASYPNIPIIELSPSANLETGFPENKGTFTTGGPEANREDDEEWALYYIDVVHLDPIVEAIDDDFSGFISIHEANRFAIARPKNWSLLRWFAYWAAGWALSVKKYKEKIIDLVQQIYLARLDALPCNLAYITDYLDGPAIQSLDTLLRSTQPLVGDHDATDSKLASLVSQFDEDLEQRLLSNLRDLKYDLPSVDKVTLVTGPGRIERFALPLICLLLQHHLRIVRLAGHYRYCSQEMSAASLSLLMILNSLRSRADKLEAVFRQKSRPVQDLFKKFSFGMLELFNSPVEYQALNNSLLDSYWENSGASAETSSSDETPESNGSAEPVAGSPDTSTDTPSTQDGPKPPEPTRKPKSLPTETDLEALKLLSQELDHEEDRPIVLEQNLVHDFAPPVPVAEGVKASILAGGWTTRAYRDRSLAVMQRDLIVMRFQDPGPAGTKLIGWGEGFPGPGLIAGDVERRTRPTGDGAGKEEAQDIVEGTLSSGGAREAEGSQDAEGIQGAESTHETEAPQAQDAEATSGPQGEPKSEDAHILEGDENIIALDFIMLNPSGLVSHYRVSPVEGADGMHWKGEWRFDDYEDDTGVRPFEMFKAPPEALRYRYILEDASPVVNRESTTNAGGEGGSADVVKPEEAVAEPPSAPTVPADGEGQDGEGVAESPPDQAVPAEDTSKLPIGSESTPGEDEAPKPTNLALARWRYAREAVLYQVRRKLYSTSFCRERARERKRYISITMKLGHEEQTEAEYCELLELRTKIDPNVCYVWNRTATFYSTRKVGEHVTSYTICDSCRGRFCFTRHFCITCQTPSFDNQVDICTLCIDKVDPITTGQFTHNASHTLFKSNRRILEMEQAHLVENARTRSKRVKQLFKGGDKAHSHGEVHQSKAAAPKCSHCERDISLPPCWVCTICPQDTYICIACELSRAHDDQHALLRIFDNVEEETAATTDVERYYNRAKTTFAEELGSLEGKFNKRMEVLTAQVEKIQEAVTVTRPGLAITSLAIGAQAVAVPGDGSQTQAESGDLSVMSRRMDRLEQDVTARFTSLERMLLRVLEAVEARR